jgi:hypothetical protein
LGASRDEISHYRTVNERLLKMEKYTHDICDWVAICGGSGRILFINLIIHEQVVLVVLVKNPTLVGV